MTKKASVVSFLLFSLLSLHAAGLDASAQSFPTSVSLSWNGVDGAAYYDIYSGDDFIVRLDADARECTVDRLRSNTAFSFSLAARTESNETLDADFIDAETTAWDGVYEWSNLTDDDNGGKVRSLRIKVETAVDPDVGQYLIFYMDTDGEWVRIFPLYAFSDPAAGEWVDYDSDSAIGISYRRNAEKFNTSPFSPGKWRVDKVVIDYDSSSAYIQTSALGLVFDTLSSYRLYVEDGRMKLSFLTEGSGIVNGILFRNPNPGEGDAFILTRIG